MAKISTTGQQTAAKAQAAPLPTATPLAGPSAPVAVLHSFVAMQDFSVHWNGCVISFRARNRYAAETALKAAISATDADVVWES